MGFWPSEFRKKVCCALACHAVFRLRLSHDVQTELCACSLRKSTPNAFMNLSLLGPERNKRLVESTSTTTQAPQSSMRVRGLVDSDAFWVHGPQGSTDNYSAVGGRH